MKAAAVLSGILVIAGATVLGVHHFRQRSATPYALWVGDSYTVGAGGASTLDGEAYQVSARLHWRPHLDGEGGTGFVANGHADRPTYQPLAGRLATDVALIPDPNVIVIDAGRNDEQYPASTVRHAVVSYFRSLANAYPSASVVVIAPYFMTSQRAAFVGLRQLLAAQARTRGWAFVDPLAEGWIDKSSAALVSADGVHPNPVGYDYLAAHLAPAITKALQAAGETVG